MKQIDIKEINDLLREVLATIDGLLVACPDMPEDAMRGTQETRDRVWEMFLKIDDDNTN